MTSPGRIAAARPHPVEVSDDDRPLHPQRLVERGIQGILDESRARDRPSLSHRRTRGERTC